MRQHQVQLAIDWVLTGRARLCIASGDIEAAAEWARLATTSENDLASYLHEYEHLTLVRLRICQGSYSKAQRFLDRLLQSAESEGRVRSVVEMLALRAISLHAQGKTIEAIADLARSLSL